MFAGGLSLYFVEQSSQTSDMTFAGDLNLCTGNSQTSDVMFAGDLNLYRANTQTT